MATMSSRVYDALRAINVPHDEARAIANQLDEQETVRTAVRADTVVVKWMVGTNVVLTIALLSAVGTMYLKLVDLALQVGTLAGALHP